MYGVIRFVDSSHLVPSMSLVRSYCQCGEPNFINSIWLSEELRALSIEQPWRGVSIRKGHNVEQHAIVVRHRASEHEQVPDGMIGHATRATVLRLSGDRQILESAAV